MNKIDLPPIVDRLLKAGAALMVSISGGKDSQSQMKELVKAYREREWTGPIFAAHANMERMEWPQTMGEVYRQARECGLDLQIIQRPQGDLLDLMIDRMWKVAGQGIPHWPSSKCRFCTSDAKRSQLDKLARIYPIVISAEGVRADESPSRAKKPVVQLRKQICADRLQELSIEEALERRRPNERVALDWRPIHSFSEEDVWESIGISLDEVNRRRALTAEGREEEALSGFPAHPAYALGNRRLSCALCFFATKGDLQNGARFCPALHKTLIEMEKLSGFTFKQGFSLSELTPYFTTETPLLDSLTPPWQEEDAEPIPFDLKALVQGELDLSWCEG